MGAQACTEQKIETQDPLSWKLDLDAREKAVEHSEDIVCSNKEVQKNLNAFVTTLKAEKALYRDTSMPNEPILLRSRTSEIRCTYERPYKFLEDAVRNVAYKLIDFHDASPDTIIIKDEVMQYFGVFLCFLSDKVNLIKKILLTEENSYGIHAIEAYRNGHVVHFLIDDYILCKDGMPMFAQPCKMRYMWPCLMERAWLKIRGNLAKRVEQTTPDQLFETFLPLPIEKVYYEEGVNATSKTEMLNFFANYDPKNKGYILTSKKSPDYEIGLSGRRQYYLLRTFIYQGKRLFYIRNPCPDMTFRGVYDNISRELAREIEGEGFIQIAPGNFVLDEDEFMQQISELMVIHYHPGNKISTQGFTTGNSEEFFIGFNLKSKGQLSLKVTQAHLAPDKIQSFYPLMYHVVRLADQKLIGGLDNKEGCFGVKNTYLLNNFSEEAPPGKYLIRLKKKECRNTLPHIITFLTAYFLEKIEFDIITTEEMTLKWQNFLEAEARRKLEMSKVTGSDIAHVICWLGDLVVVYVEKVNSKKAEVSIEVNFPELMNLECTSHPEIKRSSEWKSYTFTSHIMFVFEKIDLTAETHIRQYHLESF